MPHCWKSHVVAQMLMTRNCYNHLPSTNAHPTMRKRHRMLKPINSIVAKLERTISTALQNRDQTYMFFRTSLFKRFPYLSLSRAVNNYICAIWSWLLFPPLFLYIAVIFICILTFSFFLNRFPSTFKGMLYFEMICFFQSIS